MSEPSRATAKEPTLAQRATRAILSATDHPPTRARNLVAQLSDAQLRELAELSPRAVPAWLNRVFTPVQPTASAEVAEVPAPAAAAEPVAAPAAMPETKPRRR